MIKRKSNYTIQKYFKLINFFLCTVAAFPEKKHLKTEFRTFLFNRGLPTIYYSIWTPAVPAMVMKMIQAISEEQWEDFLDIMHMFILSCNTLYCALAIQKSSKYFKSTMEQVNDFVTLDQLKLWNETWMGFLWITGSSSFLAPLTASLYYREHPVAFWVPFLDNSQPQTLGIFAAIWIYESIAATYMVILFLILAPFVVLMTSVIINEIQYIISKLEHFRYCRETRRDDQVESYPRNLSSSTSSITSLDVINTECLDESDIKQFIKGLVRNHLRVQSVINDVSKIHKYIFFTQAFFTITHSCFLAFTMYYTNRLIKVVLKSSPILVLSYYMLYLYCWNGQRLTDTCQELFRALYRCRWVEAPPSFKKSLIIIAQFCKMPVRLTGGGIFAASLHTFLQGLQQSISYIIILKQMTPERK